MSAKLFHKQYIIHATVLTVKDGWRGSYHLPMWILDSGIQGIVNEEHAKEIAEDMLCKLVEGRKDVERVLVVAKEFVPMMEEVGS